MNEKAAPPLAKLALAPNGLVRVRTLLATTQPTGAITVPDEVTVHEGALVKVIDAGKVI